MKKNAKYGKVFFKLVFIVSFIFSILGGIADLFGLIEGIEEYGTQIHAVLYDFLLILLSGWKFSLAALIAMVVIIIYKLWIRKRQDVERQAHNLSRFSAMRRNTVCYGVEEYIRALEQFLNKKEEPFLYSSRVRDRGEESHHEKEEPFLWWSLTGVAGIGKTRLAIETLRSGQFRNFDIHWLERYDDYREDVLKKRADVILESPLLRNIIIADDAQLYMENIGIFIDYIANRIIAQEEEHIIRLLLLIRIGEDENSSDRYHQLGSKADSFIIEAVHYHGSRHESELRVDSYTEETISEIVKSYIINMKKKLPEEVINGERDSIIIKRALETLNKSEMDPHHRRPLFAMCIVDALLSGKDPMSWNRNVALEYIVGNREDELLKKEMRSILESKYNRHLYQAVRGIITLSIIRGGVPLGEVLDNWGELEEELVVAGAGGIKGLFRDLQLLDKGNVIRSFMPDILSEYYVLRTLVLQPEEYITSKIVDQMSIHKVEAEFFRRKVQQDFGYMFNEIRNEYNTFYRTLISRYSNKQLIQVITKLLKEKNLHGSNTCILHEAIVKIITEKDDDSLVVTSVLLADYIITQQTDIDGAQTCLEELEYTIRSEAHAENSELVYIYCQGLVGMLINAPTIEKKKIYLWKLQHIAESELFKDNLKIVCKYCSGLMNMIVYDLGIDEKEVYLEKLRKILGSEKYASFGEIVLRYSELLANSSRRKASLIKRERRSKQPDCYVLRRSSYKYGIRVYAIPGHYVSSKSHTNYYINTYDIKRQEGARDIASVMSSYFFNIKIDTICCIGGMDIIGAYSAQELTRPSNANANANKNMNIIVPEYGARGEMIFRENMEMMLKDKDVVLTLPMVITGKTLLDIANTINDCYGRVVGIFALFSTCNAINGVPIYSLFNKKDLPNYRSYPHHDCELCKQGVRIDAVFNDFGCSLI